MLNEHRYGFTRSSSGRCVQLPLTSSVRGRARNPQADSDRTLHFARADLRKSDSALLKKVTKAWKELKSSVRQAKPAKVSPGPHHTRP